jgi:predicted cupin superfamily sugar epimerase
VDELVKRLSLSPHPEGGFYRETYRAQATLPGSGRSVCTAILYLLPSGQRSRLHRLDADELWHFHDGGPLEVVELVADAKPRVTTLSREQPQALVRAGTWFGARPAVGTEWTLVGCTVAPGFEFERFELGRRDELLAAFPHARDVVVELTG